MRLLRGQAQGGPMRPGEGTGGILWDRGSFWLLESSESTCRDAESEKSGKRWSETTRYSDAWPSKVPKPSTAFRFSFLFSTFQFGAFLTGPRLLKVHCKSDQVLWESSGAFMVDLLRSGPSRAVASSCSETVVTGEKRTAEVTTVCTQFQMSVFIFIWREKHKKYKRCLYILLL